VLFAYDPIVEPTIGTFVLAVVVTFIGGFLLNLALMWSLANIRYGMKRAKTGSFPESESEMASITEDLPFWGSYAVIVIIFMMGWMWLFGAS